MEADPASLDNLRGLAEPPPVSWWPLAPGWWFLLAGVFAVVLVLGAKRWLAWKRDAYRRAALRELGAAGGIAGVAELLKRTALAAFPREEVAALTGDSWCDWLESTGGQEMPGRVREAFTGGVFAPGESDASPVEAFAAAWIARHARPETGKGGGRC